MTLRGMLGTMLLMVVGYTYGVAVVRGPSWVPYCGVLIGALCYVISARLIVGETP